MKHPLKRSLLLLPALLWLLCLGTEAFAQNKPTPRPSRGNGKMTTDKRKTSDFKAIDIKGNFEVVITIDKRPDLRVEADENLQAIILHGVEEKTLIVKQYRPFISAEGVKLYISVNELDKVKLQGGARLISEDNWGEAQIKTRELQLVLDGGSTADIALDSMNVRLKAGGGSVVNLKGYADRAILDVSGGSKLSAGALNVYEMNLDASGGSSVRVSVNKEFKVSVNSGATVFYEGRPEISQTVSGGGKLRRI